MTAERFLSKFQQARFALLDAGTLFRQANRAEFGRGALNEILPLQRLDLLDGDVRRGPAISYVRKQRMSSLRIMDDSFYLLFQAFRVTKEACRCCRSAEPASLGSRPQPPLSKTIGQCYRQKGSLRAGPTRSHGV